LDKQLNMSTFNERIILGGSLAVGLTVGYLISYIIRPEPKNTLREQELLREVVDSYPIKKALAELRAEREEVLTQLQESEAKHKKIIYEIHSEREELLSQLLDTTHQSNQHYTLTYFDVRGRAEQLRLLFSECGVPFRDVRISNYQSEEWSKLKPTTPTGYLPMLDHNGNKLGESVAQLVYIAKNHSRWPHSIANEALALMIIGVAEDLRKEFVAARYALETEKSLKVGKLLDFLNAKLPFLEKLLERDGFFVEARLTAADVSLWDALDQIVSFEGQAEDIINQYQKIKEWRQRFAQNPNVSKYLETRK